MNDRFRFRVWDKSEECYVDPDDCELFFIEPKGEITIGVYNNGDVDDVIYCKEENICVEQCTGLKDNKGQLIYEGDIVNILCEVEEQGVIEWATEEAQFVVSAEQAGFVANFDNYCGSDLEVIGNIHENAKLLEGVNEKATI